ncbi:unnamed protein product [Pleuronectes platessa]|uniref:Uncharacterized protein n=1 Tax=Pleuronectes platessa TaxID=8262 RepID=A0A9N7VG52_PLEPL|nr:unnamed protein product [Pleuronectes platessa]
MAQCHIRSVSPENRFSNSYSPSNDPLNPKRTRKSQTEAHGQVDGEADRSDGDEHYNPVGDASADSSTSEEEGQDGDTTATTGLVEKETFPSRNDEITWSLLLLLLFCLLVCCGCTQDARNFLHQ